MATNAFEEALKRNGEWAKRMAHEQPELFPKLGKGQSPQILWLGCADSRAPETTLLDLLPGDVFVHRNIANVLHRGDLSSLSVIEYAVVHLKVKHIVVCGHTSCGGVAAALGNTKLGILDAWLAPLRELRHEHNHVLSTLDDKEAALKLVDINVLAGVKTLRHNAAVVDAIVERGLTIHGVVYDVGSGHLKVLDITEQHDEQQARLAVFKTN
ncbi:MAG: hypothetical protein M1829_003317 [Trizodia sp. TS-e1964]|nr:MAG: hypothetical protein M1829_003317 [Trizodia sp. TS-e1964]